MRSLVTGAAGFIGSHLTDFLLAKGHQVLGIDNLSSGNLRNLEGAMKNPAFSLKHVDISKQDDLDQIRGDFDLIFHLAALAEIVPSIQEPTRYFESNVVGTYNICQKARDLNIKKIVYAASSSCYGIPHQYPTKESAEAKQQYPYALTKFLGERIVLHWNQVYKIPAISLRLFNVYGPRARTSGSYGAVMGVFLAQMMANKPLTIVGDGEQLRDFTYVTDVVSAFYCAAISDKNNEIYNVGSGEPRKVKDLANLISEGEHIYLPKRPGEPEQTFADISKIRQELDWKPAFSLEQGLSIVLESKTDWKNAPVWTPDKIAEATSEWFKYLGSTND